MAPRPGPSLLYRLVALASWPIVRFVFRTRWRGVENVPAGGAVLAANHISNFDPWPLSLGVPRASLAYMAKKELFFPPLKWLLPRLGGFSVDRSGSDREALARAVEVCREGHLLLMFPEGTRRAKGARKVRQAEAHSGAARIALRAGVPLVPAAVAGTDRLARLGPLRVVYGMPIALDDLAGRPRKVAAELATERLMEAISALEQELG